MSLIACVCVCVCVIAYRLRLLKNLWLDLDEIFMVVNWIGGQGSHFTTCGAIHIIILNLDAI